MLAYAHTHLDTPVRPALHPYQIRGTSHSHGLQDARIRCRVIHSPCPVTPTYNGVTAARTSSVRHHAVRRTSLHPAHGMPLEAVRQDGSAVDLRSADILRPTVVGTSRRTRGTRSAGLGRRTRSGIGQVEGAAGGGAVKGRELFFKDGGEDGVELEDGAEAEPAGVAGMRAMRRRMEYMVMRKRFWCIGDGKCGCSGDVTVSCHEYFQ